MKKIIVGGFFLFALVYLGMAFAENKYLFFGLFFLYGIYAAATEGIAKAWVTNISEKRDTATAIGTFTAFQSIAILIASSLAGIIWYSFNPTVTFLMTGVIALSASAYIWRIKE